MFNRFRATIIRKVGGLLRKLKYQASKVIKAIVCMFVYNAEQFQEHLQGPDYSAAIQDWFNDTKWLLKAADDDKVYDAIDKCRDKMHENLSDRDLSVWG